MNPQREKENIRNYSSPNNTRIVISVLQMVVGQWLVLIRHWFSVNLVPVGPSWSQLVPEGPSCSSWSKLAPVGSSWSQLGPVGSSWSQFHFFGPFGFARFSCWWVALPRIFDQFNVDRIGISHHKGCNYEIWFSLHKDCDDKIGVSPHKGRHKKTVCFF